MTSTKGQQTVHFRELWENYTYKCGYQKVCIFPQKIFETMKLDGLLMMLDRL